MTNTRVFPDYARLCRCARRGACTPTHGRRPALRHADESQLANSAAKIDRHADRLPPLFADEAGATTPSAHATRAADVPDAGHRELQRRRISRHRLRQHHHQAGADRRRQRAFCTPITSPTSGNPVATSCASSCAKLYALCGDRVTIRGQCRHRLRRGAHPARLRCGYRHGRDASRTSRAAQPLSARTSISSSISAGRTSSASRSATARSTASCSTRPARRAAARLSRPSPARWATASQNSPS